MILKIDTTNKTELKLALKNADQFIAEKNIPANFNQAEILLPAIDQLVKNNNKKITDITKIIVANGTGSFTSLRIGIAIANTLAYALKIEVEDDQGRKIEIEDLQIVEPKYDQEPNISLPKNS